MTFRDANFLQDFLECLKLILNIRMKNPLATFSQNKLEYIQKKKCVYKIPRHTHHHSKLGHKIVYLTLMNQFTTVK